MLFADKPMWLDCGHALGCAVFFPSCLMQWFTHWISKPPSWFGWFYYSNHGHNYCLFESLKLFVKCLQWLFFWGEGSYSSVAKGSTNVNVVVLNLGFRTGFCTSPAFIPAYAHPQKDTNVIQSVYQVSHFSATILLLYSWMFLVYFPDFWCRRQQKSSPGIVTAGGREPVVVAQVAHVSRILMVSRSNFWVKRWFHQQEWWTNGISWGSAGISADGDSTLQQPDMAGTSSILIHFVIFFVDDFPFQCPFTVGIPAWPCLITVW